MLIVVGIIATFLVLWVLRSGRTRACRWREDRRAQTDGLTYWRCAACGATEKTVGTRQPDICKAPDRAP